MPRICFIIDAERPPEAQFQVFLDAGWEVVALISAGGAGEDWPSGVTVRAIQHMSLPAWLSLPAFNRVERHQQSEAIAHALAALQEGSPLTAAVFPQAGGLAFRSLQARSGRLILEETALWVLTGPSAGEEDALEQLRVGHAERYALTHADGAVPFLKPEDLRPPAPVDSHSSRVSLVVPHYNLGAYLPEALESIACQDYDPLEVIVVDDGSTDPASLAVWQEMESRYPRFRFIRQANGGASAARNTGIQAATSEYVVLMDADNVAMPHMVSRLVGGIAHRPALAALTSFFLAFGTEEELREGRFPYAFRPAGGPVAMGCFENVFGDTNGIYRTAALQSVGGFDADPSRLGYQDWDTFVRLVLGGHQVDVLPDYLYYYRHRADSVSRSTDDGRNRARIVSRYQAQAAWPPVTLADAWGALAALGALGAQWPQIQQELTTWRRRASQAEALLSEIQASETYRLLQKLNRVSFPTRVLKAMMRKR